MDGLLVGMDDLARPSKATVTTGAGVQFRDGARGATLGQGVTMRCMLIVIAMAGCAAGPEGPIGPAGPAGTMGMAGKAAHLIVTATGEDLGMYLGPTATFNAQLGSEVEWWPAMYFSASDCTGTRYVLWGTHAGARFVDDKGDVYINASGAPQKPLPTTQSYLLATNAQTLACAMGSINIPMNALTGTAEKATRHGPWELMVEIR